MFDEHKVIFETEAYRNHVNFWDNILPTLNLVEEAGYLLDRRMLGKTCFHDECVAKRRNEDVESYKSRIFVMWERHATVYYMVRELILSGRLNSYTLQEMSEEFNMTAEKILCCSLIEPEEPYPIRRSTRLRKGPTPCFSCVKKNMGMYGYFIIIIIEDIQTFDSMLQYLDIPFPSTFHLHIS